MKKTFFIDQWPTPILFRRFDNVFLLKKIFSIKGYTWFLSTSLPSRGLSKWIELFMRLIITVISPSSSLNHQIKCGFDESVTSNDTFFLLRWRVDLRDVDTRLFSFFTEFSAACYFLLQRPANVRPSRHHVTGSGGPISESRDRGWTPRSLIGRRPGAAPFPGVAPFPAPPPWKPLFFSRSLVLPFPFLCVRACCCRPGPETDSGSSGRSRGRQSGKPAASRQLRRFPVARHVRFAVAGSLKSSTFFFPCPHQIGLLVHLVVGRSSARRVQCTDFRRFGWCGPIRFVGGPSFFFCCHFTERSSIGNAGGQQRRGRNGRPSPPRQRWVQSDQSNWISMQISPVVIDREPK